MGERNLLVDVYSGDVNGRPNWDAVVGAPNFVGAIIKARNALAVLDQLQAMSADPNPHVAALVCDRTPKAPNPDPALFH